MDRQALDLESGSLGFEPQFCHLLAVESWASSLVSLSPWITMPPQGVIAKSKWDNTYAKCLAYLPLPSDFLFPQVWSLSSVWLSATPWTLAYQASPSMGFSRQEYWSGLLFLSPGDLPDPGIELGSPTLEAGALTSEPLGKPLLWWD